MLLRVIREWWAAMRRVRVFSFPAPIVSASPVLMTPAQLAAATVQPGTTVQLPAGSYVTEAGFAWTLRGTASRPIIVEPVPGANVTIGCNLATRSGANEAALALLNSEHVIIRRGAGRLRITNADASSRVLGTERRPQCIDVRNSQAVEMRGLALDNGGNGITVNASSEGCSVIQCSTNGIGWDAPHLGRGRGHGLYLQAPGTTVRAHTHETGYGRAIQCYGSADVRDISITDCVLGPTATPSAERQLDAALSFNSGAGYTGDIELARCVVFNQRDRKVGASVDFGQNGIPERHGPLHVVDNVLLGQPSFNGYHREIDWRGNVTMGRVRSGGAAIVAWHLWEPDWAEHALEWDAEFRSQVAPSADNEWGHGRPAEDFPRDVVREHWEDGYGHVAALNRSGAETVDVEPEGFEPDEWIEVRSAHDPQTVVAVMRAGSGPISLPTDGAVRAPNGGSISAERAAEKSALQTFTFRRLP